MTARRSTGARARLLACGFAAALAAAVPGRAQDYGDTPYVQTPQNVVERMLEVAKVGPKDYVIDLGSGDGRMVITAAKKFGARGFGVDLDRRLVELANRNAAREGVAGRARFYARDLYETDISAATVMTIYLLPEVNLMVRPRLLALLRPGTRIVSHDYDMGEWPPDIAFTMDAPGKTVGRDQKSKVFYWVVPARAAGRWRWRLEVDGKAEDFELALNQNFQKVDGTLRLNGRDFAIQQARLVGEQLSFAATVERGGAPLRFEFSGRLVNHAIDGEARVMRDRAGTQLAWSAARVEVWEPAHAKLPPPTLTPPEPR